MAGLLMIRAATAADIPAILSMVWRLHHFVGVVIPMSDTVTARFLAGLMSSPVGLVQVVDDGGDLTGFIAASIGTASIAMVPVGVEHGWWAEGGSGLRLLILYEQWARRQGCFAVRMSTPPHNERAARILEKRGFALAEQAWVKVL